MKDLVIFVKDYEKIIRISKGDGFNLTTEDIDEGYVDYLYYDVFKKYVGKYEKKQKKGDK